MADEWIDDGMRELEQLRIDVDKNLQMRPLSSTAATFPFNSELESPLTAYYTPQVAYFSHANHPLPITAQALFTRMQCSPRPLLLDVRAPDSYNAFHLRGAILLKLPDNPELLPFTDFADMNTFVATQSGRHDLDALISHGDWDGDAVLYDDERTLPANEEDEPTPTWRIMQYLLPLVKGQVWYLEGGMSAASTLPHFQLVVVTADQSQPSQSLKTVEEAPSNTTPSQSPTTPKVTPLIIPLPARLVQNTPSSSKKRSVPNLRRIDTSSAQMTLPKHTLHITTQPTPASGESKDTGLLQLPLPQKLSLSTRRANSPNRITISAPNTPRAGSPTSLPPTARLPANGSSSGASPSFILSTIIPSFLYLGQEPTSPSHLSMLKRGGIKRILNVAAECDDDQGLNLKDEFDKYIRIPLRDTVEERGVQEFLRKSCTVLDDARLHSAPVYVHCRAGKSRSVMAVIAYLIHSHFWTLSKAYAFVLERREGISPNIGFVSELMRWEEAELGGVTHGLDSGIYTGSAMVEKGSDGAGYGYNYHHGAPSPLGIPTKRPSHVRESLPPFLSISSSSLSTQAVPQVVGAKTREGAEEVEVRDAWGRYRHQRRAPVDDVTLQPLRRVSKAGLESSWAALSEP